MQAPSYAPYVASDGDDAAVAKAVKNNKAIDKVDFDAVVKALNEGADDIVKAVDS